MVFFGPLACTGIGLGTLASNRQTLAVADTAIAADLDESLDIESGLTAKVTLDLAVMIYILTKLRDVILGQVA